MKCSAIETFILYLGLQNCSSLAKDAYIYSVVRHLCRNTLPKRKKGSCINHYHYLCQICFLRVLICFLIPVIVHNLGLISRVALILSPGPAADTRISPRGHLTVKALRQREKVKCLNDVTAISFRNPARFPLNLLRNPPDLRAKSERIRRDRLSAKIGAMEIWSWKNNMGN